MMSHSRLARLVRIAMAVLPLILSGGTARAGGLNFDFSITNTQGNVSGTVTGEIIGLADNATSAAAEVIILSFPSGRDSLYSPPIDATTWTHQIDNSFTVENGQVVAADFYAFQGTGTFLYINGDGDEDFNFASLNASGNLYVYGDKGLAAANIVPTAAAVPEPSSLALAGIAALDGLGVCARRRRA